VSSTLARGSVHPTERKRRAAIDELADQRERQRLDGIRADRAFDRWVDEIRVNPPPRPILSRGAALARENAELAVRDDPVRMQLESVEAVAGRAMWKAMMLSGGSLEICEALLRDEPVPLSRLDPEWVERYGLREGREDGGG
jgi:hypothetical protein